MGTDAGMLSREPFTLPAAPTILEFLSGETPTGAPAAPRPPSVAFLRARFLIPRRVKVPTPSSVRLRFGYASGALVTGAFTTLPGLLLLPYLTDTLGVGAALAGLVVLGPKAWAVLLTPLAGRTATAPTPDGAADDATS